MHTPPKQGRSLHAACACLVALSCALGAERAEAKTVPGKPLADAGLIAPTGCLAFGTQSELDARRKAWSVALEKLAEEDRDALVGWIIGTHRPPKLAMQEATLQLDCMIGQIVKDAAAPDSTLLLSYDEGGRKRDMVKMAERWERSASWRERIVRQFTRSDYRSARAQAGIWHRKFTFRPPRSFNRISPKAAEACGLTAGQTWKPTSSRHKKCWERTLEPADREREILGASSAPGISRHHWGTDFDVFGLNPRMFLEHRPLHDEYVWMSTHARTHGFFQTFDDHEAHSGPAYMEERWHWSYYPIAHALRRWAEAHDDEIGGALDVLWTDLERRWGGRTPYFDYVRANWKSYMFNVASPEKS